MGIILKHSVPYLPYIRRVRQRHQNDFNQFRTKLSRRTRTMIGSSETLPFTWDQLDFQDFKIRTPIRSINNCLTPKTPEKKILSQSSNFLDFGPPYCIY